MQNLLATDCQNLRLQHKKRTGTLVPVHFFGGGLGIRTPGSSHYDGFQVFPNKLHQRLDMII